MSDYCEWPIFFNASWPVARKKHVCCECKTAIFPGEKYGLFTGKWPHEEGIQSYKQHLDCEAACVFIRDNFHDGECIGFGQLREYWGELTLKSKHPRYAERSKQFRHLVAKIKWRARIPWRTWQRERRRSMAEKVRETQAVHG